MSDAQPRPVALRSREGLLAISLALAAALRVGVFAAAFPFFANVDEHRHVDAVLKYARGYLPAPGTASYEPEMPMLLGIYGSPEYHLRDSDEGSGKPRPPPWKGSAARTVENIQYNERFLSGRPNLEAYQPPVYYAVAGVWMRAGSALGLEGGRLLYWVRGLNALGYFALVLATYTFLAQLYPRDAIVRIGVPVLLAVFPQDALYYVTRDSFSPLMGAAGLFGITALVRRPRAGSGLYAMVGLIGATAFLSKYMNAVVLVVYALGSVVILARGGGARRGVQLLLMWSCVAIPIAIWLTRNQLLFGEILATGMKLDRLGWGRKAVAEYWDHPIFSVSGAWTFVSELIPTFWRGELAWRRATLVSAPADAFYLASSLGFIALAAVGLLGDRGTQARFAEGASLLSVLASAALLAGLSLMFVFGDKTNPTVDNPYLSQGRLVAVSLVPFALLYVRGIAMAAAPLPARLRAVAAWLMLGLVVGVVVVSELRLSGPVFASEYNWFHYP